MREAFELGGWGMYPTSIFGLVLVLVAVRYALKPDARFIPMLLSLGLLTLLSGSLGLVTGVIASINGASRAMPDLPGSLVLIGFGESLHNLSLALIIATLSALLTSIGSARVALRAQSTAR
jgi:hypothetical protein